MSKQPQPLKILSNATAESLCLALKARLYNAGGNIHQLALWSGQHEGNLHSWLHGKFDLRISTLVYLQNLVDGYVKDL